MHPVTRREFVKFFSFGAACSALAGKSIFVVEAQAADASATDGILRLKISDWPQLAEPNGSIQLGVHTFGGNDPLPGGYVYPITINRGFNDQFFALNSNCKHSFCIVPAWTTETFSMRCPCHGSEFGIEGELIAGPADAPLDRYEVSFDGIDTLTIKIPALGFRTTGRPVTTAAGDRFRLEFPTLPQSQYAVARKTSVTAPWSDVEVALTPDGPFNTAVVAGDGQPVTVYAPRSGPTGFYSVSILLSDRT